MIHEQLKTAARRIGLVLILVLSGMYVFATLHGPYGIPALFERRREVRSLQEQNADLMRRLQERKDYIERLKNSPAEQELEIRKRLKLVRPGDTEFIVPK